MSIPPILLGMSGAWLLQLMRATLQEAGYPGLIEAITIKPRYKAITWSLSEPFMWPGHSVEPGLATMKHTHQALEQALPGLYVSMGGQYITFYQPGDCD